MDLVFITNARFTQNANGEVYGIHTSINKNTFNHYLKVFDKIYVVGRVEVVNNMDYSKAIRLDSDKIEILPLPYFIGLKEYLQKRKLIKKKLKEYLNIEATFILRVPGSFGRISASLLYLMKKPFGVEVAGDPYDVYAAGTFKHPLRILLRYQGLFSLKATVKKASAALYVTEKALQNRYPVKSKVFNTNASNVILKDEAFIEYPKILIKKSVYNIVSIGTLDQMYKAPDVLLKSINLVNKKYKIDVNLIWIGDGKHKNEMQLLSEKLNIKDKVSFVGMVKPIEAVRNILDKCDLFVLASKTEGLPRALVEAMARGLPCVSTEVGGIPELISKEALVPKNENILLAKKISKILTNKEVANRLAKNNLQKSYLYKYSILNERRIRFYCQIKKMSEEYYIKQNG